LPGIEDGGDASLMELAFSSDASLLRKIFWLVLGEFTGGISSCFMKM
jgi:hypothetical protein